MTITKADLRTRVLAAADATGSSWRWDTSVGGEVDFWIGQVHDEEWARILNTNRYYRMARRTPTSDSSGRYVLTDLNSGSGDSQERWFRVIAVAIDSVVYKESQAAHFVLTTLNTNSGTVAGVLTPWYYWWFEGDYLVAIPKQTLKQADAIMVNHRPTRFDQLVEEGAAVVMPDGYEQVIVWEAAARLLHKGGVESLAAAPLEQRAEESRAAILSDIARRSTNPTQMQFDDYARDWGSV